MRLLALYRKYMTADLYEWTGTVEDRQYSSVRPISLTCHMDAGTTLRIFTDEPLQSKARVRNIKDRWGNLLYPTDDAEGMTYEVFMTKPIVTPMQSAEGFENQAKRLS